MGDNPNTAWNDVDADASCMVLNSDYTRVPRDPLAAIAGTTAHEFNHAIQFGYGALAGANVPDDVFFEGGATWMEDEVFDASNDNCHYLWPAFSDSLGDYDGSPYGYWIMMRGLTERFGTGTPGGGEQVMQDFWESTSQGDGNNLSALRRRSLAQGRHPGRRLPRAVAIGIRVHAQLRRAATPCALLLRGGRRVPCRRWPASPPDGSIAAGRGQLRQQASRTTTRPAGSTCPPAAGTRSRLPTRRAAGQLRASAVCDTGSGSKSSAFPAVVGAGGPRRP